MARKRARVLALKVNTKHTKDMKTVTLKFIPHNGSSLTCKNVTGQPEVNVTEGQPMVRVTKRRGFKKTVEVFAAALGNLAMVKADDRIVWLH